MGDTVQHPHKKRKCSSIHSPRGSLNSSILDMQLTIEALSENTSPRKRAFSETALSSNEEVTRILKECSPNKKMKMSSPSHSVPLPRTNGYGRRGGGHPSRNARHFHRTQSGCGRRRRCIDGANHKHSNCDATNQCLEQNKEATAQGIDERCRRHDISTAIETESQTAVSDQPSAAFGR